MSTPLDIKKKSRSVTRGAFTRSANELEQHLLKKSVDVRNVQVAWKIFKPKYDDLQELDSRIDELMLEDACEEDLLAEIDGCDGYRKRFADLSLGFEELINEDQRSVKSNASTAYESVINGDSGRRKFKLPTIEFKRYDGNIKDWLSFWAQFKKVHEDPDIDKHDKIEYLLQATVSGSRARQLVESFPAMGENYEKIVDSMQSRFGREDLQIEVYVRELLKLILNTACSQQKMEIGLLYDKIETQIRALDTLGITSQKCSAILFPLIESCLPQDLLRIWQRSSATITNSLQTQDLSTPESTIEARLQSLMLFLKNEVENEQRILLATEGFGISSSQPKPKIDKKLEHNVPTATGLVNVDCNKCIFCCGTHDSNSCFKASDLNWNDKKKILIDKRACFRCLKTGHQSQKCRNRLKCVICSRSHVVLMCPNLSLKQSQDDKNVKEKNYESKAKNQALTNYTGTHVFLQTLKITLKGEKGSRVVRALIDSGSQRSYILTSTADQLGYRVKRKEKVIHCLFGGAEMANFHNCYDINACNGEFHCTFEALDQSTICSAVSPMFDGPWTDELRSMRIDVSDTHEFGPIEVLIGADVAGMIYTGERKILQCGLVAMKTHLGWTVMGKSSSGSECRNNGLAMLSLSLFVQNASITDLWQLETLGITEPSGKSSRKDMENAAKEFFLETISVDQEGRYQVRLPWIEGHPPLPENWNVAKKRLMSTVKKLEGENLVHSYDAIFNEWECEGITEEVINTRSSEISHYLPHRPVIKENSCTTKIRPVFDASSHEKGSPSLNDCLEKGLNLIEEIPTILLRFRQCKFGVVSDIRKAFLQISVHPNDRDILRFLWIKPDGTEKMYRHRRVVFGVNSSPFLLGATIEYHLSKCLEQCKISEVVYSRKTVLKLSKSFYVDNCVTSVPDEETLNTFIRESTVIMEEAKFDLRGWEHTQNSNVLSNLPVLGLIWNPIKDTLSINDQCLKDSIDYKKIDVTKRLILSMSQRVFDPIGFICPCTLLPKLLLQNLWEKRLSWDHPVEEKIEQMFRDWIEELPDLFKIEIPRWIHAGNNEADHLSLHTFCDASKNAYACVVFLRVVKDHITSVFLVSAKSRVAPLRKLTIPRLELLAATIGARLYANIIQSLDFEIESHFWSDSTTVLAWIQRKSEWKTFVWNRVIEIRSLTNFEAWRHVPGVLNPCDLPSRGCSPKKLADSKWWEGPEWLYDIPDRWPLREPACNEEEIQQERKTSLVTTLLETATDELHLLYFSEYYRTIRMVAWIFRFVFNAKYPNLKRDGELAATEIDKAEIFILKSIQKETFSNENDKKICGLNPFIDENGLIRLKSRISRRNDVDHFRFPVVLPSKHPVVNSLILEVHKKACHVGIQGLQSLLREKYWILGGRKTVKAATSKCSTCKRHESKPFEVTSPPLPLDRVRDAVAFEVIGVDMAGPLYLRTNEKAWICLFTCAVYRAVHLELCSSLSTACFLQAFRRFVSRRGRPKTVYSDNGTNFVGAENALSQLDWNIILRNTLVQRITWRFNPPTAAWWGGFWERLIGVLKRLLRKVLGRASLNYEDLLTVICDCEEIINSRPLTYLSNDPNDLMALTPCMFLRDLAEYGVPDCDSIDQSSLCRKVRNKQKLRDDLRRRFRNEYLGQLKLLNKKCHRTIALGEIVLIGNDNDRRMYWPLGLVISLKSSRVFSRRLQTSRGQLLRPVQRLYPLECVEINGAEAEPVTCVDTKDDEGTSRASSSSDSTTHPTVPEAERERGGRHIFCAAKRKVRE